jgi:hypothetical protein
VPVLCNVCNDHQHTFDWVKEDPVPLSYFVIYAVNVLILPETSCLVLAPYMFI